MCPDMFFGSMVNFLFFMLFNFLQMSPPHHCTTNTAPCLPITPCINQLHLYYLNGLNGVSRHIIWAYGNYYYYYYYYWYSYLSTSVNNTAPHLLHHPCQPPPCQQPKWCIQTYCLGLWEFYFYFCFYIFILFSFIIFYFDSLAALSLMFCMGQVLFILFYIDRHVFIYDRHIFI